MATVPYTPLTPTQLSDLTAIVGADAANALQLLLQNALPNNGSVAGASDAYQTLSKGARMNTIKSDGGQNFMFVDETPDDEHPKTVTLDISGVDDSTGNFGVSKTNAMLAACDNETETSGAFVENGEFMKFYKKDGTHFYVKCYDKV
jgi:hypothetical protein